MKPHKHAELIKAWADGAEIEWQDKLSGNWFTADTDGAVYWSPYTNYRIKPEPKPDVVMYCGVAEYCRHNSWLLEITPTHEINDNLKLTFDGETGELKSAEVLK